MRISNDEGTINTRIPENALMLSDLQPGDVFRFRSGSKKNIYIMGQYGDYFHLNGNTEYSNEGHYDKSVILYPDAHLTLGDEKEVRDED